MSETNQTPVQRFGFLAGQIVVPSDFDRMGAAEIAQMFDGKDEPAVTGLVSPPDQSR